MEYKTREHKHRKPWRTRNVSMVHFNPSQHLLMRTMTSIIIMNIVITQWTLIVLFFVVQRINYTALLMLMGFANIEGE